jgi:hypothetical protein
LRSRASRLSIGAEEEITSTTSELSPAMKLTASLGVAAFARPAIMSISSAVAYRWLRSSAACEGVAAIGYPHRTEAAMAQSRLRYNVARMR